MERIDIPEEKREDFYLYVDEFQNFATESFADILSEARKYHLNLIIAHQYIEQLDDKVRAAVFGNVGTIVCFRVGASDAEELVKEFTPQFTEEDLVNLAKYDVYLKLMIDGVSSNAFSATTLPPMHESKKTGNREKVIRASQERYATKREVIEEEILRWSSAEDEEGIKPKWPVGPSAQIGRLKDEEIKKEAQEMYKSDCWVCGQVVEVPFKPDGIRPVYCKECLQKVRAGLIRPPSAPRSPLEIAPGPIKPPPIRRI